MNFQLILLDQPQKENLNCSISVSLRAARSTECNADCPTAPTIDEVQHSNADDCNIAQVLIYGCWTTSSELSGLSQADKVSLLQGVLKTQVQEV